MQALNSDLPMGSILLSKCRSNACKIHCKRWIVTLLWGQSSYPDVDPMRVNTMQALNSDLPMGSLILSRCRSNACKIQCKRWIVTLLWGQLSYPDVVQCVQNTMQASNRDLPMGSIILSRCRSNACKIQCKCWIVTLLWDQLSYPDVAPMHVKYDAIVE
jgi:hypothetical protein